MEELDPELDEMLDEMASGRAARLLNSVLLRMKAANARLDAESTSSLCVSDLKAARLALETLFYFSERFMKHGPVELDEAMYYLRKARVCELLLSLLRRWPWADMRRCSANTLKELALLPRLLSSLFAVVHMAARVRDSQLAAAYMEISKRCNFGRATSVWLCWEAAQSCTYEQFICFLLLCRLPHFPPSTSFLCGAGIRICSCTRR